jgi:hypothetical protein
MPAARERSAALRVGARVRRLFALVGTLGVLALTTSCGDTSEVHILAGACSFGAETRLFDLDGPTLDDLAVAPTEGGGAYFVWSERSGSFGVALAHDGTASGDRERLGPPCTGGLDAIADGARTLVACSVQGDRERGDRGAVVVYARDASGVHVFERREGVGEGHGVALARGPGGALSVGWQDATSGSSAAWVATVGSAAEPLRLSRGGFRATAPALAYDDGSLLAVWGELWLDDHGSAAGRLQLQAGNRAPRSISTLAYELPLPVFVPDEHGALLAFRDRRPAGTRPAEQVARIDASTREATVSAAAHANATGGGVAVPCQGAVMVVVPRTHSRTERLVSVRRHGSDLTGLGPEQQLYEHGATFEWTDAACVGDRLLVVFGARSSPLSPVGSVRATTVDCASSGPP